MADELQACQRAEIRNQIFVDMEDADLDTLLNRYRDVLLVVTLINDYGGLPPWMQSVEQLVASNERREEYLARVSTTQDEVSAAPSVLLRQFTSPNGSGEVSETSCNCSCDIDISEKTRNRCLFGWGVGTLSIGILLMLILVPLSFCGVERQEMGFMWNRLTTVDTSTIYEHGNHFVGLNRLSLTFPTTYQVICYTQDDLTFAVASGQVISIDLCFHYVIQKDGLAALFRAYGLKIDQRIAAIGRSAIKNAGATFILDQYVTDRDTVQAGMLNGLLLGLNASEVRVQIPVEGFILGQVFLPDSIISRNLQIFEQTQLQVQQGYELTATLTRYATKANISAINATTTLVLQQAAVTAKRMTTAATLVGVATLRSTVGKLITNMSTRLQVKNSSAVATLTKFTLLLSAADRNGGLTAATPGITVVADSMVSIVPHIIGS